MEHAKGNQKTRYPSIKKVIASERKNFEKQENSNIRRRQQYATDVEYADKVRRQSRESYRKDNPLPSPRLENGLLRRGTVREVFVDGMDHPVSVECYTLPEAAEGLGRTLLTLNRWIKDDLLPGPYLRETVRKFRVYSIGELQAIARVLARHEHEFAYFTTAHTVTRNMIHQTVHAYRVSHI